MASSITLTFPREEVLNRLAKNLKLHRVIIAEAEKGYREQALKALKKRMGQLEEGRNVHLSFDLRSPQSHVSTYETMIAMLSDAKDELITLTADQHACLMRDQWDWSGDFIDNAAQYSATARALN